MVESTVEPNFHGARERELSDQKIIGGHLYQLWVGTLQRLRVPKLLSPAAWSCDLCIYGLVHGYMSVYQIVQKTRPSTMHLWLSVSEALSKSSRNAVISIQRPRAATPAWGQLPLCHLWSISAPANIFVPFRSHVNMLNMFVQFLQK